MNHTPELWGRPRDDVYGPYDHSYLQTTGPNQHTQQPIVTGTSVLGVKYKDGVVLAADNLASYGSLARFTDVKRLRPFNRKVCLGFGGDISDMQYIDRHLTQLSIRENYTASPSDPPETMLNAKNLHTHLSKMMYKRRSEMEPLWNVILIAGLDGQDKPFLASVDLLGTTFTSPTLATGFGAHLAQPILRKRVPTEEAAANLGRDEAIELIKQCMKVLFYRDARSIDRYSIAVVSKDNEIDIKQDEKLEQQSWGFAAKITGYSSQVN